MEADFARDRPTRVCKEKNELGGALSAPTPFDSGALARNLPFIILVTLGLAIGVFFFQVVKPLLMPLFLAAVVALLVQPWHRWLLHHMPPLTSATIITATILLVVVAPISAGIVIAVKDLGAFVAEVRLSSTPEAMLGFADPARYPWLADLLAFITRYVPIDASQLSSVTLDVLSGAGESLYRSTMRVIGNLPWVALSVFTFCVSTWFFLVDGTKFLPIWRGFSPLRAADDALIRSEFASVCRGVVWGTLLAAIAQALLMMLVLAGIAAASSAVGIGDWIILLGLLTLIFAMIPFVGAAAVWGPTAIWMLLQGHVVPAISLIVLGALVISTADNLIKIWAIKDAAKLHPLFVFICVFGGLRLLGIPGVFVGPIVGAVLFAIVKVLRNESSVLIGHASDQE